MRWSTRPQPERIDRHQRTVWRGVDGREAIELYQFEGMRHGTPIDVPSDYGKTGPYMLDVGISLTRHIARNGISELTELPSLSWEPKRPQPNYGVPMAVNVSLAIVGVVVAMTARFGRTEMSEAKQVDTNRTTVAPGWPAKKAATLSNDAAGGVL